MSGYLLDANHLSPALKAASPIRERVYRARHRGVRIGTCVPILCELETFLALSKKSDEHRKELQHFLSQFRIWPLDKRTARLYGEIFAELRAKGKVLSPVDMMLAALARQMNLTILTTDQDFAALPDLKIENWLV